MIGKLARRRRRRRSSADCGLASSFENNIRDIRTKKKLAPDLSFSRNDLEEPSAAISRAGPFQQVT
jgi:hypothetical protein